MPEANDTVIPETTETDALEVNGTEVDESTGAAANESGASETETKAPTPEEVEELRKELNKAQMEINQRRNKEKELEEAKKAAELEALEKEGKFQEIAESLKQELAERTAQAERDKAESFRNGIIDSYGPEVAEKARALNLYWDEAPDYTVAETQLRAKLDILKSVTPTSTAKEETPQIDANNPMSTEMGPDFDSLQLDEQIAKLRKELGYARR